MNPVLLANILTISRGYEEEYPAYDVEAVDTTGAGDCFNAGFIAGRLAGMDVFEACRFASATAAYKISGNEDCDMEKILVFMNKTDLRR